MMIEGGVGRLSLPPPPRQSNGHITAAWVFSIYFLFSITKKFMGGRGVEYIVYIWTTIISRFNVYFLSTLPPSMNIHNRLTECSWMSWEWLAYVVKRDGIDRTGTNCVKVKPIRRNKHIFIEFCVHFLRAKSSTSSKQNPLILLNNCLRPLVTSPLSHGEKRGECLID